ncbi:AraC family transcriptional regulator [Paenibacillus aurantius]|uniref:AraC family transcriptional regulator n=1 Tax=Paenibacillus aurantius TaxID=2918900 RepID=A0AA96LD51_9BACL|nr:AraC family transcriptional regulator [Paenibacillus aurantius]WNQ09916.1 AraC family transcriptional regulator [Paenibacillus aurantius]
MEFFNENIQYENPLLSLKIFEAHRHREEQLGRWHYHKELEFYAVQEGHIEVHVEDEFYQLKPGELALVGSSQLHRDRTLSEASKYYVFQFDIQHYMDQSVLPYFRFFFEPGFPLSRLNYIFKENEAVRREVYDCVQEIFKESQAKQEGYEIAVSMLIKKIILCLIRHDSRKLMHRRDNADLIRLKPVLDYIDENLSHKIQVEEASKVANISYYYFVKYFKKAIGMSFLEYVNYKKIKRAERFLLTKDMSVAQIGEEIGMPNMAHFYKLFKKYNDCSPNEYRKKMLEWSQEPS